LDFFDYVDVACVDNTGDFEEVEGLGEIFFDKGVDFYAREEVLGLIVFS
jgi:hypothetical protein